MSSWHHMKHLIKVVSIYLSDQFPFRILSVGYFLFINTNFFFRKLSINLSFSSETAEITDQFSGVHLRSSSSSADLPLSREKKSIKSAPNAPLQWNPFEDSTPFDQMTEDHIYEAEFDALRDRPRGMNQRLFDLYEKLNVISLIITRFHGNRYFQHQRLASPKSTLRSEMLAPFFLHKIYHHQCRKPLKRLRHQYL